MANATSRLTTERLLVWMAWRRYLTRVRACDPARYEAVEERAWESLVDDLASVGAPLATESHPLHGGRPLAA